MTEIAALLERWLAGAGAWLPFGYAFAAGMVATVNPCGFAMLPAYLSVLMGVREDGFREHSAGARGLRALVIGAAVTAGFVALFGVVGALVALGGSFLVGAMPWLAVVVGLALVLLGLWSLSGRGLSVALLYRVEERVPPHSLFDRRQLRPYDRPCRDSDGPQSRHLRRCTR